MNFDYCDALASLPHCTGGGCRQGRLPQHCDCPTGNTEMSNVIPLRAELPRVALPVQVQHYPTPRIRRVRRFFRDLVAFLKDSKCRL